MSKTTQQFALLLFSQVVCVAVALWFHSSQTAAFLETEAERQLWKDLQAESATWLRAASADASSPAVDSSVARNLLAAFHSPRCNLLLTDPDWQPLASASDTSTSRATTNLSPITWHAEGHAAAGETVPLRGRFSTPVGEQLAVAWPLQNDGGYLVFHRPAADAHVLKQSMSSGLWPLSLITLAWTCALLGVVAYLVVARFHDAAHRQRLQSTLETLKQTQRLVRTQDSIIFALAKLADSRDPETGDHLERITAYATTLAAAARRHPKFATRISPAFVRLIEATAVLHDIGKVGVADAVLRKCGPLTPAERAEMERHTSIAGDCLREIAGRVGNSSYLEMAEAIAVAHHEHWDGSGYPAGLRGEQIPLAARIVAIADVYDALSTRRVYKNPLPHAQCAEQIVRAAGAQFDPDLVSVFQQVHQEWARIAARWGAAAASPGSADPEARAPGRHPASAFRPTSSATRNSGANAKQGTCARRILNVGNEIPTTGPPL